MRVVCACRWRDAAVEAKAIEVRKIATIRSWMSPMRPALNSWIARVDELARLRLHALRWSQYGVYRLWRRWSVTFMEKIGRLKAAMIRWTKAQYARGFNMWSALAAARVSF